MAVGCWAEARGAAAMRQTKAMAGIRGRIGLPRLFVWR
jgi:hypothetical protein